MEKVYCFRATPQMENELDYASKVLKMSRSKVIRTAVVLFLNKFYSYDRTKK